MTGAEIVILAALFMFLTDDKPLISAECSITDTSEVEP